MKKHFIRDQEVKAARLLRDGFFHGMGFAAGVTVGFGLVSTLLVFTVQHLGGLPLVGGWLASIVKVTLDQLTRRTPMLSP